MKLIRGLISLATLFGVGYGTWRVYDGNGFELAAVAFGILAIGRATLMAWLRRNEDVYGFFKTKATAFVRTPMQEFAFMAPIYAAPGLWTQYGLMGVAAGVPAGWIVLRGIVRFVLGDKPD